MCEAVFLDFRATWTVLGSRLQTFPTKTTKVLSQESKIILTIYLRSRNIINILERKQIILCYNELKCS